MTSEILFEVSTSFLEARIPDSSSTGLELSFLVECLESGLLVIEVKIPPTSSQIRVPHKSEEMRGR